MCPMRLLLVRVVKGEVSLSGLVVVRVEVGGVWV